MKNRTALVLTVGIVILSMSACSVGDILPGGAAEAPLDNPADNQLNTNGVDIVSTSSFTDGYGGYYVVGEVTNNLDSPITSVDLSISIMDDSGASLLKDDNGNIVNALTFYSMLSTLDTGESSPFSYYFDTENGIPANYEVTVNNYEFGSANRGQLQNENVQIIDDGSGYYILTGELVNLSTEWVHIHGLAGGVLDDNNIVLSADWTGTYTTLLAPTGDSGNRDRTPFYASFPIPQLDATQWSVWWDADIEMDVTDYPLLVDVTYSYFDEYGSAHLVGTVINNSGAALTSLIVAGLYAEDGTVLDASYSFLAVPIQPGLTVPFDVSYFGSVNWNEEQAALVHSYTVQIDPWSTYPPFNNNVGLTSIDETIQKNDSTWTVTGNFTNTTSNELSGVTVMAAVYDPSGTLVAMGYTYSFPAGDTYAPGDSDSYEIYIYLDPVADTNGYTIQTYVIADLAE
jgi:hypothetical protein